WQQESTWPTF
nr:immunoglobulin light chain junction region [Macaca mulatta]MPN96664.1 immunoglobulin light chain junction region [Macaca mulatta]MPN97502.1 immunoglobulin light chain junction region [Macaca mulatta]